MSLSCMYSVICALAVSRISVYSNSDQIMVSFSFSAFLSLFLCLCLFLSSSTHIYVRKCLKECPWLIHQKKQCGMK